MKIEFHNICMHRAQTSCVCDACVMQGIKMYTYFYHNPVKGYNVLSDQAKPLDDKYREDMLYDTIGDEPGSFFGVISPDNVTLQFYLEDNDDTIRMEIPTPQEQGSYATNISFDQALKIVKGLKGSFFVGDFPKLKFESWL